MWLEQEHICGACRLLCSFPLTGQEILWDSLALLAVEQWEGGVGWGYRDTGAGEVREAAQGELVLPASSSLGPLVQTGTWGIAF